MDSILVVELTRLGDVISTIPALGRLRSAFAEAQITCIVQEQYAPLLRALDIGLEAAGLRGTQTLVGLGRGIRKVRRIHADLACSMSPAKRNAILTLGSGASVNIFLCGQ
jgi:ADP-heptose:LPS heptosyltransferase